jgi:hypothetical protein
MLAHCFSKCARGEKMPDGQAQPRLTIKAILLGMRICAGGERNSLFWNDDIIDLGNGGLPTADKTGGYAPRIICPDE